MSFLTESAEVGNIGLKQLREQREITTQKWDSIGLLEGLEGNVRENCAQLFENQASYLINEQTSASDSGSLCNIDRTAAFRSRLPQLRRSHSEVAPTL